MKRTIYYSNFRCILGNIDYVHDGRNIVAMSLGRSRSTDRIPSDINAPYKAVKKKNRTLEKQLAEYFRGERKTFNLSIRPLIKNAFTSRVLKALKKVPYGKTISYKQLAFNVKAPGASRAVGNALGKNPCPIILPCHRIIKTDGKLGGFTGGIANKKKLLKIEGITF